MQLYKNNARALLSRMLSIINPDWLQYARSVRGVYELNMIHLITHTSMHKVIFQSYVNVFIFATTHSATILCSDVILMTSVVQLAIEEYQFLYKYLCMKCLGKKR